MAIYLFVVRFVCLPPDRGDLFLAREH